MSISTSSRTRFRVGAATRMQMMESDRASRNWRSRPRNSDHTRELNRALLRPHIHRVGDLVVATQVLEFHYVRLHGAEHAGEQSLEGRVRWIVRPQREDTFGLEMLGQ